MAETARVSDDSIPQAIRIREGVAGHLDLLCRRRSGFAHRDAWPHQSCPIMPLADTSRTKIGAGNYTAAGTLRSLSECPVQLWAAAWGALSFESSEQARLIPRGASQLDSRAKPTVFAIKPR